MTLRVAILISGSGSNMMALAESMVGDHPARACLVISDVPRVAGFAKAESLDIPTICVNRSRYGSRAEFEAKLLETLSYYLPDIICLAGFMRILSPNFVALWEGHMLNIHPSLLPLYPGLNTHARAIEAGDAYAGCTVHQVTAALDGGPILGQERVLVQPGDTPETLAARILPLEHKLYPEVLRRVADNDRRVIHRP